MASAAHTYSCPTCTYNESINASRCSLCNESNPNQANEKNSRGSDEVIEGMFICPSCTLITVGRNIKICEHCFTEVSGVSPSKKKPRLSEQIPTAEVIDIPTPNKTETSTPKKKKQTEAVEVPMTDNDLANYYQQYLIILNARREATKTIPIERLHEMIKFFFTTLQYKNDTSEGQLIYPACQICYDEDEALVRMKSCDHQMICFDDFHQYLSIRIRDEDIFPWIPCPAEICNVPCHADNMINDGRLTYSELLSFIKSYMFKKLSRNENFVSCAHCSYGGFLQFGQPRKEQVQCSNCQLKQTIEKGSAGELDDGFQQMIRSGTLRECPTCRHLTLKEQGVCNVIQCVKCAVWWNWRTREQGHSERDLKQRARMNGTLWEPGELHYQQMLERTNPAEFKALLERNGIAYNPNYVRGGLN